MVENTSGVSLLYRGIHLNHQVAHVTQHQIHHDVDMILILMEVVERGDAGVIQVLHDFFLPVNRIEFLWLKFLLFVDLDCNIFAGFFVPCLVHVRLTALADYFFNIISVFELHGWLRRLDHFDQLVLADRG